MIFFNAEKYCSKFTDVLITINKEDYINATERMYADRVEYVSGAGVDTHKFVASSDAKARVRQELNLSDEDKVFLSVGELIPRKNHIEVFEALHVLDEKSFWEIIGKLKTLGAEGILVLPIEKMIL